MRQHRGTHVHSVDPVTKEIVERYPSMASAARDVERSKTAIVDAIRDGTRAAGLYWRNTGDPESSRPAFRLPQKLPVLVGTDRYESVKEAAAALGVARCTIYAAIARGKIQTFKPIKYLAR